QEDEIMVSFDISSLYPSIPIEKTILLVESWLKENQTEKAKVEMYMDLLKLCTRNSFFQFENRFYDQVEGLGMGNPLAPFLASEIFLGNLEMEIVKEGWFPRVWLRYMDDVFAVIKENELAFILKKLNSLYPSIKFTFEKKNDLELPFLDVLVRREVKSL